MAEDDRESTSIVKAIMELKGNDPFVPFRILMTNGKTYSIKVSDNLVELKSEFFYAFPGGEDFAFLRKNQIAAVEGSEGKRPRRKAS